MTLTELRYIVAVARQRHFGRAAEACFVSQPTLSVAIRKLEDELGVTLFERRGTQVDVTPVGADIIEQARLVLGQVETLKQVAKQGRDPLSGPLRLGVIYTVAPYLLPQLVRVMHKDAPKMPLILREEYTHRLRELLDAGEIDTAIQALPFDEPGFEVTPLYDEPFMVTVQKEHEWATRRSVKSDELTREAMVLLGTGHCFRDQVLKVCPELNRFGSGDGMQKTFEGSSLETIRQMVASGIGITVLPATSIPQRPARGDMLRYIPFTSPAPDRRIVLIHRKTFPRKAAIDVLRQAVLACELPGARKLA